MIRHLQHGTISHDEGWRYSVKYRSTKGEIAHSPDLYSWCMKICDEGFSFWKNFIMFKSFDDANIFYLTWGSAD